mgnify:CR=1 FL=1
MILAQAGEKGAVTIGTNMAGRGVDIALGGDEPKMSPEKDPQEFEKEVEDNLEKLQKLIFLRQYTPEPNKTIYIPKDNNESRKLNLPTIHDKIVQICVFCLLYTSDAADE